MALKAGRVGVLPSEVTPTGKLKNSGGSISTITLGLNTNTDNDPIINLEYIEGDEHKNSPVAFNKDDFEIVSNHIKVKDKGNKIITITSPELNVKTVADYPEKWNFNSLIPEGYKPISFAIRDVYTGYHFGAYLQYQGTGNTRQYYIEYKPLTDISNNRKIQFEVFLIKED